MHCFGRKQENHSIWITVAILCLFSGLANAAVSNVPLTVIQSVEPRVLLMLSNDHQLYKKAYSDYDDLDSDGILDTTYKDTIDYDGYFDSNKCYTYTTSGTVRFSPSSAAAGANGHDCAGSLWSGNFLNWVTMTRMDILRKTLYGGKRVSDPASTSDPTILERAFLPKDVHSYVKTYQAASAATMQNYTPFAVDTISFCNVSWSTSSTESQSLSVAPQVRVAQGFFPFWAMSEVEQCQWGGRSERPDQSSDGLGLDEYTVYVEVCNSSVGLEDNCDEYPSGNNKPIGIIQEYGEEETMLFGLMTGSYQKNRSGGVLRKNIGLVVNNSDSSADEIAYETTGQFINQGSTDEGIINTINRFRISKYNSSTEKYTDCSSPGILKGSLIEGGGTTGCSNWGNPIAEMYLEGLRYLSGSTTPTTAFNATDSGYIPSLPNVTWTDPTPAAQYCAKNSIILLSAGINSFDVDGLASASDIPGLSGSASVNTKTDTVGSLEGISGSYLIGENGSNNDEQCTAKTITGLSQAQGICPDAPSLEGGFQIAGLAYHAHTEDMRDSADYPDDQTVDNFALSLAERIPTFSLAVSGGTVKIVPLCEANSTGSASFASSNWRTCSIVDMIISEVTRNADNEITSGRVFVGWEDSTWGNDYDMDGVQEIEFCVGSTCSPAIGDNEIQISTGSPYAAAGHALLFGYIVSGTTSDGAKRLVIRTGGVNFSDWTDINIFENKFNDGDAGTTPTFSYDTTKYTASSADAAGVLNNPLWYMAKYGGFDDEDEDGTPANEEGDDREWDVDGDGDPDNYYPIKNFNVLNTSLEGILDTVVERSTSSASIVANSVRLQTGTKIYQARYNSTDWSGQFWAFPVEGNEIGDPVWDAGDLLSDVSQDVRIILSYDPDAAQGIPFRWDSLTTGAGSQQELLKTNPDSLVVESDAIGESRVEYLRGDDSNEQDNGGTFRDRDTKLGDIVNSAPFFVGEPPFSYSDTFESAPYSTFVSTYSNRTPIVYTGGNDGMLHGFSATSGEEVIAYVPNSIFANLNKLTSPDYAHRFYVDGNVTVVDAFYNAAWHSVLIGTLRAGGQGLYALDVTDPTTFSEGNASNLVMWEFTDDDDADLGFTFSQAAIVKMNNGKWAAVFGNGYNNTESDGAASATGYASLFIVFIEDGLDGSWGASDYMKIDTETGSLASPNGLGTPAPIDENNDGLVDSIYAGDLEGNVWKFDVSGNSTTNWRVAYKQGSTPKPLFTATDGSGGTQPVMVRPEVVKHPDGGYMVLFGTGKYFETDDNDPSTYGTRTFYGVRDNGSGQLDRSTLVEQEVLLTTSAFDFDLRITSDNQVDFTTKDGWYMDLPETGEKVVFDPVARGGNIIFVTLIPSSEPCEFGGSSWLMELNSVTGARASEPIFDINNDGAFSTSDLVDVEIDGDSASLAPTGKKSKEGILTKPAIISAGEKEYKFSSGSSGNIEQTVEKPSLATTGRKSWRQIQ